MFDEIIDEKFVCKKYVPYFEADRAELFEAFLREIKILHLLHHPNIVRVFNYHIYPEKLTGYIIMDFIDGYEIDKYISQNPESINDVFQQVVDGFSYLESAEILHRDIRVANIMVTDGGTVKIIDFGFGKSVSDSRDFQKSINLNWPYSLPQDISMGIYDFRTEVFFVGKLFESLISSYKLHHFKYDALLKMMCAENPEVRMGSFSEVKKALQTEKFSEIVFDRKEVDAYRRLSSAIGNLITKLRSDYKLDQDADIVMSKLQNLYKRVMLERVLPNPAELTRCFIVGEYYFDRSVEILVSDLKDFIEFLKGGSKEKRSVIISNLYSRIDAIRTYDSSNVDDDVPF